MPNVKKRKTANKNSIAMTNLKLFLQWKVYDQKHTVFTFNPPQKKRKQWVSLMWSVFSKFQLNEPAKETQIYTPAHMVQRP